LTTIVLVIVGILLAAASALMAFWYGGDAYNAGSTRAVAASTLQAVEQVADARQLWSVQNDTPYAGSPLGLAPDYLSMVPANPTGTGLHAFIFVNDNGDYFNGPGQTALIVGIDAGSGLAGDSPEARAICLAAARQVGQDVSRGVPMSDTIQSIPGKTGCWKPTRDIGGIRHVFYYIFRKL
jgi:hypothetical protein